MRAYRSLAWATGERDKAEQGQPVVTGFTHSMQMAVLLVTENLFARLVTDGATAAGVLRAVETWEAKVA